MNQKEAKKYIKDCKAKEEYERKVKTYKGDWPTPVSAPDPYCWQSKPFP